SSGRSSGSAARRSLPCRQNLASPVSWPSPASWPNGRRAARVREAPVPGGDLLRDDDRRAISDAVRSAERTSGFRFSLLIGDSGDDARAFARDRHALLADPGRSVLVMVDPQARALEIVTGATVRRVLDDSE